MYIQIVKNKYLNALFILMLVSAVVHMLILFFVSITTQNLSLLNYFNIIQLSYFFADFGTLAGTIISFIFVLALYQVILMLNNPKE